MYSLYYYSKCFIKIIIVATLAGCIIWGFIPEAEAFMF